MRPLISSSVFCVCVCSIKDLQIVLHCKSLYCKMTIKWPLNAESWNNSPYQSLSLCFSSLPWYNTGKYFITWQTSCQFIYDKLFFHSTVSDLDVWRRPVMFYSYVILLLGYHVNSHRYVSRQSITFFYYNVAFKLEMTHKMIYYVEIVILVQHAVICLTEDK